MAAVVVACGRGPIERTPIKPLQPFRQVHGPKVCRPAGELLPPVPLTQPCVYTMLEVLLPHHPEVRCCPPRLAHCPPPSSPCLPLPTRWAPRALSPLPTTSASPSTRSARDRSVGSAQRPQLLYLARDRRTTRAMVCLVRWDAVAYRTPTRSGRLDRQRRPLAMMRPAATHTHNHAYHVVQ